VPLKEEAEEAEEKEQEEEEKEKKKNCRRVRTKFVWKMTGEPTTGNIDFGSKFCGSQ
jgi:hypothetical protein